jgi:hypothetical protein
MYGIETTFGTTNISRYGVRKIEAISSSSIIPVYCIRERKGVSQVQK